jgi:hypothetical protein
MKNSNLIFLTLILLSFTAKSMIDLYRFSSLSNFDPISIELEDKENKESQKEQEEDNEEDLKEDKIVDTFKLKPIEGATNLIYRKANWAQIFKLNYSYLYSHFSPPELI